MEEITTQRPPILVKRSGRASSSRRATSNCPMLPAECQAEEHCHATGNLAHECGHELEGERLSQRVSIRLKARPKIPQKDKSVTSIEYETDKIASEDEATQGASV